MKNAKKPLIILISTIFALLVLSASVVVIFDPFYQYHGPIGGMSAVLYDPDNQVPGSIRTLDYDSILVGSSVAENCDTAILDQGFGCNTLKVIKTSGSTADLLYFVNMVHENRKVDRVFYCLDISALLDPPETVLLNDEYPRYLHTSTILDDSTYLWNKEILFEKIPLMFAYAAAGRNTGGNAYYWADGKNFSSEQAMKAYAKNKPVSAPDSSDKLLNLDANLEMLVSEVNSHPDTEYYFFIPSYSLIWWDCAYTNGILELYYTALERIVNSIPKLDNAALFDYQTETEIVYNLDNYMDMVHYAPWVNQYMLEKLVNGEGLITTENAASELEKTKAMVNSIIDTEIYRYYE